GGRCRARRGGSIGAAGGIRRRYNGGALAGCERLAADRPARGARHRLGGAACCGGATAGRAAKAALYSRPRCTSADRSDIAAPMIRWLFDIFSPIRPPIVSNATSRDVADIAALHAASFRRGWSDGEIEGMLLDRNVVGHRATIGRHLAGFVISRIAADEAEILSIAVAERYRGRAV